MHRVAVFDSGVGGLSISASITALRRDLGIDYLADRAFYPYGKLDDATLVQRTSELLAEFCQRTQPDLLVVACNTASTLALPALRDRLSIPVVGVVPAIKPAAAMSRTRVIALLATSGTVERPYTRQLIDEFAADCTVIRLGCSELVDWVERDFAGEQPDVGELSSLLDSFHRHPQAAQTDTMVLACTHFPLASTTLQRLFPQIPLWIDSGAAIARRVDSLLPAATDPAPPEHRFFYSGETLPTALSGRLPSFGFQRPPRPWH